MESESIVATPRIDVQFVVPSTGRLTQAGYALLSGLIRRTGGSLAPVIDIDTITRDVAAVAVAPVPVPYAPPQDDVAPARADVLPVQEDPCIRMEALAADVEQLRGLISDLQVGRQA